MTNYPHGDLLARKAVPGSPLVPVYGFYQTFRAAAEAITVTSEAAVSDLVIAFNAYRRASVYIFESGLNVPQENLRSTMMEEFLGWLFKDVFTLLDLERPSNFRIGKSNRSYLSLDFAPRSFADIFSSPNPCIHTKDQDFALGANVTIVVSGNGESPFSKEVVLPVVAIECKTYLAKNHLDMCSSTAASLKKAMPYCKYMILAEFLKMGNTATPEFTDISEIFVVCKAKNTDRKRRKDAGLPPHDVHADVIYALFTLVITHLRALWWDPASVLTRGVVIARP